MKLRLKQEGYETYTGQMGTVFFDNGLSITDVKPIDAVRIAAQFICTWEDGSTASVAQSILDHSHMTVGDCRQEVNADQAIATQAAEAATLSGATRTESVGVITAEKLSEIADRDGIKGLRAIAEPLGIKSNSIADMMRAILEKQGA
jgi:hypothetical protein